MPKPAPQFARATFLYRGRQFRIFKRSANPTAKWYLYFEHKTERKKLCLGDTAKLAAIETAKLHIQAILDGNKAAARKLMERPGTTNLATVQELTDAFLRLPGPSSARGYVYALANILRKVHPGKTPEELSSSVFADDTAERFFALSYEAANAMTDQRLRQRHQRTANSLFNQAKCIFSERSQSALKKAGIVFPDPKPFTGAMKKHGFKKVNTAGFELPSDAVIRRMLIEWKHFKEPTLFLAVGLALACGLRRGEILQARWGWFTERMGVPVLYSDAVALPTDGESESVHVKNQTGKLEVVPLEPFWRILNRTIDRHDWRGKPDELIVTGLPSYRTETLFRIVSDWLAGIGWNTKKKIHSLRDYGASLITMKYGLDYAKMWCRHSSITTTEKHYSRFVDPVQMVQRRKKLRWLRFAGETV